MDVHDLTAAYALDALEPDEAQAYEEHLGQCEECRAHLAELNETAAALAFGAVAPAPPPHLGESILSAAAAERTNVVPLPQRRWRPGVVAVAAAVACVAIGFGVSALTTTGAPPVMTASVVVAPDRTATLHVSGLPAVPRDKTYEAWVITTGGAPRAAGLLVDGTVTLQGKLPRHAVVAVTVEPAGGSAAPTTPVVVSAIT